MRCVALVTGRTSRCYTPNFQFFTLLSFLSFFVCFHPPTPPTTDEHVAKQLLRENLSLYSRPGPHGQPLRRKRIAPLVGRAVFAVGRAVFRSFTRGRATRSGSRLTQHYGRRGSYSDATRDFQRLRPDNVRSFGNRGGGGISGRTGTMGNGHRVTVRDGSRGNSRPTLEIRSHQGSMVRKFRYNP